MTTEPVRPALLELLAELSREFPSMRIGQMICNLTTAAGRDEPSGIWDVEDEELLEAARQWIEFRYSHVAAAD